MDYTIHIVHIIVHSPFPPDHPTTVADKGFQISLFRMEAARVAGTSRSSGLSSRRQHPSVSQQQKDGNPYLAEADLGS
ncbi:hypothetical protein WG66_001776 [Moniliophthora roreri]|nr:hypothetical protein WG66_001776 [Moniliophthora roreri]